MEENLSAQNFTALPPGEEDLLREMFEAGIHWGRRRSRTHPKMRPYLFSSRGELEIIDLQASAEKFKAAFECVGELARQGKTVLIIGTQPAAQNIVREIAQSLGFPYVTQRWLGGTLTNFKTFQARIEYLKSLEAKIQSPDFEHYTKKERLKFQLEYQDLQEKFDGLTNVTTLPAAIFVIGVKRHDTAVREAKKLGITIIAVVNTDDNPTFVDWPIPANDNSSSSVRFILEKFKLKVEEARKAAPEPSPETTKAGPPGENIKSP